MLVLSEAVLVLVLVLVLVIEDFVLAYLQDDYDYEHVKTFSKID